MANEDIYEYCGIRVREVVEQVGVVNRCTYVVAISVQLAQSLAQLDRISIFI